MKKVWIPLSIIATVIFLTVLYSGVTYTYNSISESAQQPAQPVQDTLVEPKLDDLLTLTNKERNKAGLASLTINNQLNAAAQLKANDMIQKGYWSHDSPDGVEPWYWLKTVGYDYSLAGENLAKNFAYAYQVNAGWMNSESHRNNVLGKDYTEVGFATSTGMVNDEIWVITVAFYGAQ